MKQEVKDTQYALVAILALFLIGQLLTNFVFNA
jgi:hypothetical protein